MTTMGVSLWRKRRVLLLPKPSARTTWFVSYRITGEYMARIPDIHLIYF